MHSLPVFLRLSGQPVVLIGDGAPADAKRRLIERAGARIIGEEEAGARFAFVAGVDAPEPVHARLKARDLLVNVADRPDLCDFTVPAIVDRDPVIVAVGTGGASAGLAAVLRQRLEALLPESLGRVAVALKQARLQAGKDGWRERLGVLLAPGGPLDPMVDHSEPTVEWDESRGQGQAGRCEDLTIISSDPDELTLRAARLLAQAERIYHTPDMPSAILDRARADAERIVGSPPALLPPGLSLELIWTA